MQKNFKPKSITDVVHPMILERAKIANQRCNDLADATGHGHISLELSTMMVELASIQHQLRNLQDGK